MMKLARHIQIKISLAHLDNLTLDQYIPIKQSKNSFCEIYQFASVARNVTRLAATKFAREKSTHVHKKIKKKYI